MYLICGLSMRVIPVIDLMSGLAVRARGGLRESYRPIETPLAAGAAPGDVAAGLLRLHPFEALYIADLDAIEGRGDNAAAIEAIAARFPDLQIWLDRGERDLAAARAWFARNTGVLVAGSESQRGLELLRALRDEPRLALSLDFRGDEFLGPPEILANPTLWPGKIIVMTLARVGAGAGPDLARLAEIIRAAGGREVYAAGGLRGAADLAALKAAGAAGVLAASALHDGRLRAADLS